MSHVHTSAVAILYFSVSKFFRLQSAAIKKITIDVCFATVGDRLIEDVLTSDSTRGSRDDFKFSSPGRTNSFYCCTSATGKI